MKFYTGIGSRSTPADVLALMTRLGAKLCDKGYALRSGGAEGADTAFYKGVTEYSKPGAWNDSRLRAQVFLPWASFGDPVRYENVAYFDSPAAWTFPIAEEHHPAWDRCSQAARKLHARNVHQVLGSQADYNGRYTVSSFVLCWTPGASGSGGTGQAIRIAKTYGVPVYDLADPSVRRQSEAWVSF